MELDMSGLECCEELWFNDGTVVFRAESRLFRVYGGLLAFYSSVFRDMFSVPQPPAAEMAFGCHFVELPDRAFDVYHMFKLIHDAGYMSKVEASLNISASVLRLCTKYDIPFFRQYVVKRFEAAYPSKLDVWDSMDEAAHDEAVVFSIVAINAAIESGLRTILPIAVYSVCSLGLEPILDGFVDDDGIHHILSPLHQRAMLLARRDLAIAHAQRTLSAFMKVDNTWCKTKDKCNAARHQVIIERLPEQKTSLNYLALEPVPDAMLSDLCSLCQTNARMSVGAERIRLWQDLPSIFNLDSW